MGKQLLNDRLEVGQRVALCIESNGQHPNSVAPRIDCNQGSFLQVVSGTPDRLQHSFSDRRWKYILCPHLDYTRSPRFPGREK